jgi:hypothetical protein
VIPGAEGLPFLYRFRPLTRVLDDGELENQEMYLSSPEELNDPMEGLKDVVWRGDEVLWRNLMRHYMICLTWSLAHARVGGEQDAASAGIAARLTDASLPTDEIRAVCAEAYEAFVASTSVDVLFQFLGRERVPLRRQALHAILVSVHLMACECLSRTFENHGLQKPSAWRLPLEVAEAVRNMWTALMNMSREGTDAALVDAIFAAAGEVKFQADLLHHYNQWAEHAAPGDLAGRFLLFDFSWRYLDAIVNELLHPRWYAVCFAGRCNNAAMWSAYADGHRGVALKFRAAESNEGLTIPLQAVLGTSTTPAGTQEVANAVHARLYQVRYTEGPLTWDFFTQLGQLSRKDLAFWHQGQDGQVSAIAVESEVGSDAWRARYWDRCRESVTVKLQDWAHEQEHRLVLWDMLGTVERNRMARYDFGSLCGVVFGMRTPTEEKLRIMRILQAKCAAAKRDDFELFQADYSPKSNRIELRPLPLLRSR